MNYKEPVRITRSVKNLLENLKPVYKWIVKDSDNLVFVFTDKPKKNSFEWINPTGYFANVSKLFYSEFFDFISWEDEEPTNIKELLANCEVIDGD